MSDRQTVKHSTSTLAMAIYNLFSERRAHHADAVCALSSVLVTTLILDGRNRDDALRFFEELWQEVETQRAAGRMQ